jgi:hypothetical protein
MEDKKYPIWAVDSLNKFWLDLTGYETLEQKVMTESCRPLYRLYFDCSRNLYTNKSECPMLFEEIKTCEDMLNFLKTTPKSDA